MKADSMQEKPRAYPLIERLRSVHQGTLAAALGLVALVVVITGLTASLITLVGTNRATAC